LLGERPRQRDLLIEHLHLIQDRYGALAAAHLAALAHEMRLGLSEVYEVATFYAHFDVVKEGSQAPPPITIRVCDSLSCALAGAGALFAALASGAGSQARVVRAPCMGACDRAPVCAVGHQQVMAATAPAVIKAAQAHVPLKAATPFVTLSTYTDAGGYRLLRACLAGERTRDEIIGLIDTASLRGLGGAGFPTGRKWKLVQAQRAPRLMADNADEGEPGTFKDRY